MSFASPSPPQESASFPAIQGGALSLHGEDLAFSEIPVHAGRRAVLRGDLAFWLILPWCFNLPSLWLMLNGAEQLSAPLIP